MRPVKLAFSGINSYRDPALVDFEHLGRGGVFGIFGPTGSGKSTILDAITLALYSKVDRAPKNTRGIINLGVTDAWVSFEFLLGGETYSVERKFSKLRNDPHSARATSARLTKGKAEEVLADLPTNVTAKIEELLGLTSNEFSRAVALPQGKFDEFLKLAGAERADMLGRIFDLERFGDPLFRKASKRQNHWKGEFDKTVAAQRELGDVSDEAIKELENLFVARGKELESTRAMEEDARKRLGEAQQILQLGTNLAKAEKARETLRSRAPLIERYEEALFAARRANPLGPAIDQIAELEASREAGSSALLKAKPGLEAASRELLSAKDQETVCRDKTNKELPNLYSTITKMEGVLSLSLDLQAGQAQLEALLEAVADLRGKLVKVGVQEKAAAASLLGHTEQVLHLSRREGQLRVDPKERERVASLLSSLERLDAARDDAKRAKSDLEKKESATEKSRKTLLGIYKEIGACSARRFLFDPGAKAPLSTKGDVTPLELGPCWTGADVSRAAREEMEESRRLVQSVRTFTEAAYVRDQAAVLAHELRQGEPCPVCGSDHHPSPALGSVAGHETARECLETVSQCSDLVSRWRERVEKAVSDWDAKMMVELEAWEEHDKKQQAVEGQTESLSHALGVDPGDTQSMEESALAVRKSQAEIARKDKEQPSVLTKLSLARVQEEKARTDLEEARRQRSILEQELGTKDGELRVLGKHIEETKEKVMGATGGVDPARAIAGAKDAIANLEEELSRASDRVQSLQKDVSSRREAVVALSSRLQETEERLSKQKESLERALVLAGFCVLEEARGAMLAPSRVAELEKQVSSHKEECLRVDGEIAGLERDLGGRTTSQDQCEVLERELDELSQRSSAMQRLLGETQAHLRDIEERRRRWGALEKDRVLAKRSHDVASRLAGLLRGKALVRFLSEEHLRDMAVDASAQLGALTSHRFALEYKDGDFQMRDDYSGGQRRPTGTLSGGETFLTSLALALALSGRIQLRGQYPLGFFFLDEGFGTLDGDRLEAVVRALESLRQGERLVGVISHVKELRERLPYYLDVVPPTSDGTGSRIVMGSS